MSTKAVNTSSAEAVNKSGRWFRYKRWATGYLMLLPFILLFLLFIIIPVFYGLFLSFTTYNIVQPMRFNGIDNYVQLFTADDWFLTALSNTLRFAVVSGPIGFLCSFFFAWVINQLKFRNVFSLAFYAPSIVSSLAITIVWLSIFSSDRYGHLNNLLLQLGIIQEPLLWTTSPQLIMSVIIFVSVWMSMGSGFLTNLAGLSNINTDLYEAAAIDGINNRFQQLFYITMPQMKPQLLYNAIMATVSALNVYDIAVAIGGNPSPSNAALTIVGHMYDYAFTRFELGYASAISFILFLMCFICGQIFMKIFSSKDE